MRRISSCLNPTLKTISDQVLRVKTLNDLLGQYLPELLRAHCHVGNFSKGCLTLVTSDPVWASQLRYYLPELRDKLRTQAQIHALVSIKIQIASPELTPSAKHSTPHATITQTTKAHLLQSASQCNHPPLQDALKQLIQHLTSKP